MESVHKICPCPKPSIETLRKEKLEDFFFNEFEISLFFIIAKIGYSLFYFIAL